MLADNQTPTHSEQVKNLIYGLCKDEHIPVETLHRLIGIKSPATFKRRLDEPSRFTKTEIDRIAIVLELKKREREILTGENL